MNVQRIYLVLAIHNSRFQIDAPTKAANRAKRTVTLSLELVLAADVSLSASAVNKDWVADEGRDAATFVPEALAEEFDALDGKVTGTTELVLLTAMASE